jgi:glucosyl-3-phosphoglycerate phosphatase
MTRTFHLIRHGQSTFNQAYELTGVDPGHIDAPLTELGLSQVEDARRRMEGVAVDLVIASPLTRALQTALGVFKGRDVPVLVTCKHRERLESSCDVGRSPARLIQEFPSLSFDHLADPWWHDGEADERGVPYEPESVFRDRVEHFGEWLEERPERAIAIVGHGTFFRWLTGRWMANCEVVTLQGSLSDHFRQAERLRVSASA